MNYKIQEIYNTFLSQALRIAFEINKARYTKLGIQEEALTDLLLNQIQFENEKFFLTKKFTHKEEGNLTGADWLWCIGEPDSWITFAVQAKIENIDTKRVNYLHYRGNEQYNLLINFCKHFGFIPKYSIYAVVNKEIRLFTKEIDKLKDIPIEQWSFSMISPKYIKNLSTCKERNISSVLQFSVPWTYIFTSETSNNRPIAEIIAGNLENIYWLIENKYRQQQKQQSIDRFKHIVWENPQPSMMISKNVPLPVLYFLTQKNFSYKIPIANVSIFSNTPVQLALDYELAKVEGSKKWKSFPMIFKHKVDQIQDQRNNYLLLSKRL